MAALSFASLRDANGHELDPSPWLQIDQARIDAFADCTDDHQWIHVDRARAGAGPFGTTIAHGYLTLALLVPMLEATGALPHDGSTIINYGLDKLRFLHPVPSGSRVRLHATIADVTPKGEGRLLVAFDCRVEIEGQESPAVVARVLHLVIAPA